MAVGAPTLQTFPPHFREVKCLIVRTIARDDLQALAPVVDASFDSSRRLPRRSELP